MKALDIRKQEFNKTFRGYDAEEVDAFLQTLSTHWQEQEDQMRRQEERLREYEMKLRHYTRVEEALEEALKTARESSRQAIEQAEHKAAALIEDAEQQAIDIKREAERDRHEMKRDVTKITGRKNEIVARLRAFLMSEMELLARFDGDDPSGFIKLLPAEEVQFHTMRSRSEQQPRFMPEAPTAVGEVTPAAPPAAAVPPAAAAPPAAAVPPAAPPAAAVPPAAVVPPAAAPSLSTAPPPPSLDQDDSPEHTVRSQAVAAPAQAAPVQPPPGEAIPETAASAASPGPSDWLRLPWESVEAPAAPSGVSALTSSGDRPAQESRPRVVFPGSAELEAAMRELLDTEDKNMAGLLGLDQPADAEAQALPEDSAEAAVEPEQGTAAPQAGSPPEEAEPAPLTAPNSTAKKGAGWVVQSLVSPQPAAPDEAPASAPSTPESTSNEEIEKIRRILNDLE